MEVRCPNCSKLLMRDNATKCLRCKTLVQIDISHENIIQQIRDYVLDQKKLTAKGLIDFLDELDDGGFNKK